MRTLYPRIEPYRSFTLDVGEGHTLYVEECGAPGGVPALFLHGGPGAGCEQFHRRFFDPAGYRVILFDQRGSGRSTPHAEIRANDTQRLVADIEALRQHLGLDRWLLFGGSWGSTLALCYAQAHPERCLGLVLRGIFLCRPRDLLWFYQDGAGRIFPEAWRDFQALVPEAERGDMIGAYYRLLTGPDAAARLAAARAWAAWEGSAYTLTPRATTLAAFTEERGALSLARIECHYFKHDAFLQDDQLLRGMDRIKHLPGVIVHGRYDVICPVDQAVELHRRWPGAELHIAPAAGHSGGEPEITARLVEATDALLRRLA